MYPDFKELLSVFNAHSVKYLVVGAYAVSLHAQPRASKDLDILVKPGAENARLVYAALAKFGAALEGLTSAESPSPLHRHPQINMHSSSGRAKGDISTLP